MTLPGIMAHFLVLSTAAIICSFVWPQANGQFFAGWVGGNIAMAAMLYVDRKYREASK